MDGLHEEFIEDWEGCPHGVMEGICYQCRNITPQEARRQMDQSRENMMAYVAEMGRAQWSEQDAKDLLGVIGLCRREPQFYKDDYSFTTVGYAIQRVLSRHGYKVSIDGRTGIITTEKNA